MLRFSRRFFSAAAEGAVKREVELFDVLIVGGGPAGLSAAIHLKNMENKFKEQFPNQPIGDLRVGLIDKGSDIGAHTLSGACLDPRALKELLLYPEVKGMATTSDENSRFDSLDVHKNEFFKSLHDDLFTDVTTDKFYLLPNSKSKLKMPWLPPTLHNSGNYIVSLGALCMRLKEKAEELGVEVYPGFAAADVIFSPNGASGGMRVEGVQLHDMGINKKGVKTEQFEPGMLFKAKQTIFAEGARGSCTKKIEKAFGLRENSPFAADGQSPNFQVYGLGIKEVWEIPKERHENGSVVHTVGWPTNDKEGHYNAYGGAFLYQYKHKQSGGNTSHLVSCGYVVGLDYKNAYTRPYMEMQKWKTHDLIRGILVGPNPDNKEARGEPLHYGARALVEGGLTSLPKLTFNGGVLVGDCAGFLNLPKIKGNHAAMKSGILAAEAVFTDYFLAHNKDTAAAEAEAGDDSKVLYGVECKSYTDRFLSSWLHTELYEVRNVKQAFHKNFYLGMLYAGAATTLVRGKEPFTLPHTDSDHTSLRKISECKEIHYPKPDGVLTFDLLTNHARSGTEHNADQPAHLKLTNAETPTKINFADYGGPEARYCPAGVYEFDPATGALTINAQNCLHCKTCDIKDPTQNINWCVPEGGGGPNYMGEM